MSRIPYFDPSEATGRAAEAYGRFPHVNILRMIGHSGDLIYDFAGLGLFLSRKTSLNPILREVAILRVAALQGAHYVACEHELTARGLGMSPDLLTAIRQGPSSKVLNSLQRLVMTYVDDVVSNVRAGEATFQSGLTALGAKALQELTLTIGFYMMVSRFVRTFDIDIDLGAGDHPPT